MFARTPHSLGISLQDLKMVAQDLGDARTDEELQEMITAAARENDKVVNERDFLRIIRRKP